MIVGVLTGYSKLWELARLGEIYRTFMVFDNDFNRNTRWGEGVAWNGLFDALAEGIHPPPRRASHHNNSAAIRVAAARLNLLEITGD